MSAEEDPKVTAARAVYEEAKKAAVAANSAHARALEARDAAGRMIEAVLELPVCDMYDGEAHQWLMVITRRDGDGVWARHYGHPDTDALRFVLRDDGWVRDSDDDAWHGYHLRGVP